MEYKGRLGKQPFVDIIQADGRYLGWVAERIGIPINHFGRVSYGHTAPSPEMKDALVEFLERPVEELFTPEALAAVYVRRKNAIVGRAS